MSGKSEMFHAQIILKSEICFPPVQIQLVRMETAERNTVCRLAAVIRKVQRKHPKNTDQSQQNLQDYFVPFSHNHNVVTAQKPAITKPMPTIFCITRRLSICSSIRGILRPNNRANIKTNKN